MNTQKRSSGVIGALVLLPSFSGTPSVSPGARHRRAVPPPGTRAPVRPGLATLAVCSVADDAIPTGVSGTSRTPALTGGPPSADDDRGTETSAAPGQRPPVCRCGSQGPSPEPSRPLKRRPKGSPRRPQKPHGRPGTVSSVRGGSPHHGPLPLPERKCPLREGNSPPPGSGARGLRG